MTGGLTGIIQDSFDVLQSHFSDILVLDFVSSIVRFTGYSVNSTKSTSQPSMLSLSEATEVMSIVTDVAITNYVATWRSARLRLVGGYREP